MSLPEWTRSTSPETSAADGETSDLEKMLDRALGEDVNAPTDRIAQPRIEAHATSHETADDAIRGAGASARASGIPPEMDLEEALDRAVGEAPAQSGSEARLVVASGQEAGRSYPLGQSPLVIGRSPAAHIRIRSDAVSMEHARIEPMETGYRLVDLGSTNGTWVSGRRVVAPHSLRSGERIDIADTELVYLVTISRGAAQTTVIELPFATGGSSQALAPYHDRALVGTRSGPGDLAVDDEQPMSLEEQVRLLLKGWAIVRRYWVWLVAAPALGAALGMVSAFALPPPSEATLDISIEPPAEANSGFQPGDPRNERFYAAAERAFKAPRLVRQTLESLGEPKPSADRVTAVNRRLQFSSTGMGAYRGVFTAKRSDEAVRFLSRHLANYLQTEVDKTIKVVQSEVDFLTTQVREKEQELRTTEQALKEFKQKNLSRMPENVESLAQSAAGLEPRRVELAAQVTQLTRELALAKERMRRESPLIESKVAAARPYSQALVDVKRRLSEAKASGLGDDHPTVKQLTNDARELEKLEQQTATSTPTELERRANPEFTRLKDRIGDIEAALSAARVGLGGIDSHIGKVDEMMQAMPQVEAAYAQLSRSYEANSALYRQLFERLRNAQVRLELERSGAEARYDVIAAPQTEGANLAKAVKMRAAILGALGMMLALLVVAVREFRAWYRTTFRSQAPAVPGALVVRGHDGVGLTR
jgi:uncharacterized protein involved in exopolysaccharide biosynthesis